MWPSGLARPPWRAFLTFDIVNAGLGTFLMGASFGALGPTLGDHLKSKLNISEKRKWMLGVVYGIPAIVYGVACPVVGILTDKSGRYRRFMRAGYACVAAAFFMMGPCPLLHGVAPFLFKRPGNAAIWLWAVTAMVLFGVGGACGFIPTMPAMQRGAVHLGPAALEVVNSLYWAIYFSGEGTGPMLGSIFCKGLGFEWGYTGIGILVVVYLETMRHFAKDAGPETLGPGAVEEEREAERARIELVSLAKKDDGPEAAAEAGAAQDGSAAGSSDESETARLLTRDSPLNGAAQRSRRITGKEP
jgi:MFS family permease